MFVTWACKAAKLQSCNAVIYVANDMHEEFE
jgi:hypothetical protein